MGEKLKDTKRVAVPFLCSWCGLVRVGTTWIEDRRNPYEGRYSDGVCPRCQVEYQMDSLSQVARKRK